MKTLTSMTPEDIARVTHEANRAYCLALGDASQVPWDAAPDWQRSSAVAGVQSVLDGSAKTPEDQHESWANLKRSEGWVYGPEKDPAKRTHPCLVPYADLPPEQQKKDHLFRAVVKAICGCTVVLLALAGCALPSADLGQGQGGSVGPAPVVNVTVTFSGDVKVDGTTAPTAAPAATSSARADQTAETKTDLKPAVGDSALKALTPTGTTVEIPVVEPPR